eukprot:TRINITY_DN17774_c0_g1_i4.p1 TRINITY_DN17774_c0_g1~~TRINITY_DN17774_c0_g1_i4.p1  ORF type:complete len:189 (+),score=15.40 TRINITY_DN17774_c0_g1_i4:88-654(+)
MAYSLLEKDDNNAGGTPSIPTSAFVAPGACVIGDVRMGERSSVWFNTVIRSDGDATRIGEETNIQDLTMCHCDPGVPLNIGNRVTVGHKCLLHGCTIEDDVLIGMGAIIMNKAVIRTGSIVGAGAVVLENFEAPPYSLIVGSPATVKKTYDKDIIQRIQRTASSYVSRAAYYKRQGLDRSGRSASLYA